MIEEESCRHVDKFDRFLQSCPITSRPRDIPAGNIRQDQTDLSPHFSLGESLRGCGAAVSEELIQRISTHSSRSLAGTWTETWEIMNTLRPPKEISEPLIIRTSRTCVRVPFC